nr:sigma-54-dependent Fis family transcriptional regulator [Verrucomicrobiota bacterium]
DLFYRLNVIAIRMPPLRERPHDLKQMAAGCLQFFSGQCGKHLTGFSPEVQAAFDRYAWPGNLRELRNVIEHAVIFAAGPTVALQDLPEPLGRAGLGPTGEGVQVGMRMPLEQIENEHIRRILAQTSTMEEAAQILGIARGTLYERKKKLST